MPGASRAKSAQRTGLPPTVLRELVPDDRRPAFVDRRLDRVEDLDRTVPVDVPDQRVVHAVPDQLAQTGLEAGRHFRRDAELLVLLLADEAGAVVHRDPDARRVGGVRAAAVPEAA